jgi:hypothetical protein
MEKRLFCFWTGLNPMPSTRFKALKSMENSGLNVVFIDSNNIQKWILPDHPLNPAYEYLCAIHRADYLRVYFMHHYGGGYCDIKYINKSWLESYQKLIDSEKMCVGYREVSPLQVARVRSWLYPFILWNWKKLLGNCAYIFKPNSAMTSLWLHRTEELLNKKYQYLKINPAIIPEEYKGKLVNGKQSNYPLRWSELLGDIFHPLCLEFSEYLSYELPTPDYISDYDK